MACKRAASVKPGATLSDEREELRRGKLTFEEYLDHRAARAVRYLRGSLSDEQLELVRETTRAQLENDPNLSALVQEITGRDPRRSGLS